MSRSADLLRRFRLAGTPGGAAVTGVPADRVAELAAELEPVLALLADNQLEAQRIRDDGRRESERITKEAGERARDLVAAAHAQAEAERAAAAVRVTRLADDETASTLAAAERDAELVTRRAAERMPAYVERAGAAARDLLERTVP